MIVTDTHKAITTLVDNGFSYNQAECLIDTLNAHGTDVATKTDLKTEIANLKTRLTWKMVGLLSLFTIIVKWL